MTLLGAIIGLLTAIIMVMSFFTPYWRGQARYVQILAIIHFFGWMATSVLESPPMVKGIPVYLILSTMMCGVALMNMYDNAKRWKAVLFLSALVGAAIDMTITVHGEQTSDPLSPQMYDIYAWANNGVYYIILGLITFGALEKSIWRFGRKRGWIKPVPSAFASSETKLDWGK